MLASSPLLSGFDPPSDSLPHVLAPFYSSLLSSFSKEFNGSLIGTCGLGMQSFSITEEMEEKLLARGGEQGIPIREMESRGIVWVTLEQCARGVIHMVQFAVSYCIMLLFMYSNGTYRHPLL
jgi:copper transporter 1